MCTLLFSKSDLKSIIFRLGFFLPLGTAGTDDTLQTFLEFGNALITTLSTYIHIYLDDSILEYSVLMNIRRKIKDAYRRYRTFSSPSTRSATRSILHALSNGTNVNYHIFKIYIHFSWEVVNVKLRKSTFRHLFYSRLFIYLSFYICLLKHF